MNDATIKTLQADYGDLIAQIDKLSGTITRTESRLVEQRKDVARIRGDLAAVKRILKQNDALPEEEAE